MRIALDGLPLSVQLTGIGYYTLELARHLAKRLSDEIFILSPRGFVPSIQDDPKQTSNLHFIRPTVNPFTRHWWSIGLPRYLRKNGIQVFHGTNFEVPLRGNLPSVVSIHDLSPLLHPETHEKNVVRRARVRLPLMAQAADRIVTPTKAAQHEIHEHLKINSEKTTAIPEAARSCFRRLDYEQTKATRARLGIGDEFVLYVGTIEPRKNLLTLVHAFEEISTRRESPLQLVIAGRKGWMIDDLLCLIKESPFNRRMILTGYLNDDELCALYSSCTVFVYPSFYEGFGLPPLEAMACGAPVIASRIPSISETVGEAALLFNPKDVPALASSIISLLEDESLRQTMSRKGMQRASEFSWERTAKLTRAVYDQALDKNASVKVSN